MRILWILIPLLTSISLVGCSSVRGNVVPQTGPSMEQVYDSMGINKSASVPVAVNENSQSGEADVTEIRQEIYTSNQSSANNGASDVHGFHKLPNPELRMYVYPHLAGTAEIPIPGYSTVFNAYDRDHYALTQETSQDE